MEIGWRESCLLWGLSGADHRLEVTFLFLLWPLICVEIGWLFSSFIAFRYCTFFAAFWILTYTYSWYGGWFVGDMRWLLILMSWGEMVHHWMVAMPIQSASSRARPVEQTCGPALFYIQPTNDKRGTITSPATHKPQTFGAFWMTERMKTVGKLYIDKLYIDDVAWLKSIACIN